MNYVGFSISIFRIKNNKNNNNRLLICKFDNAVGQGIMGDRVLRKKVLVCALCVVRYALCVVRC